MKNWMKICFVVFLVAIATSAFIYSHFYRLSSAPNHTAAPVVRPDYPDIPASKQFIASGRSMGDDLPDGDVWVIGRSQ